MARWPAAVLALAIAFSLPARAQSQSENLKHAKDAFDYGDFAGTSRILDRLDIDALPQESDRVEAYRLDGLSHYYLGKPTQAEAQQAARVAFFNLLKEDPDYQLDPLFVPPDAVAFLDSVRHDQETVLAPIRTYRRARLEEQQREQEARRQASMVGPGGAPVEKRFAVNSPIISYLPFGLGQFQNGNPGLGSVFAAGEGVSGLTSALSALMIEALRDPTTGMFKGASFGDQNYAQAQAFNIAKWIGAGIFYALWISGAIEAAVHYVPQRPLNEPLPSAAPAGPLKPPTAVAPTAPVPAIKPQ